MNHRYLWILLFLIPFSNKAADNKLKDPTKPPAYAVAKADKKIVTSFVLSEIRITDDDRQAVINGKRLRKGNAIAGYRVKKIAVGHIILVNEKGTLRLNLVSSRIIRKKL